MMFRPTPTTGGEAEESDDVELIAIGEENRRHGERQRGRCAEHGRGFHTFFTSARPNRPCGITARAMMTSAKVTICVWVEPNRAVISASARP